MYVTDGVNTIYIYGLYSSNGSIRFDALDVKPAVGDTIVLTGKIKKI